MRIIWMNRSTAHPIIMMNPSDGNVKTSDGKYVFVGLVYGTKTINNDPEKVQELLQLFPRLNAEQLRAANTADGVYTWLLYSVGGSDEMRFVCTHVVSPFEIGTRHQSLAYNSRVDAAKIYGGGELIKTDNRVRFNLLSGTYTKQLVKHNFNKSITKDIVARFKTFFPDADYDDDRDSYITRVHTVSNELVEVYRKYGFIVRLFDTYNDWSEFSNAFWRTDFKIEHFKKQLETGESKVIRELYMENLERMIELLESGEVKSNKKGGGLEKKRSAVNRMKTRRNYRKRGGAGMTTRHQRMRVPPVVEKPKDREVIARR